MKNTILLLCFFILTNILSGQPLTILDTAKEVQINSKYLQTNQKIKIWIPKSYLQTKIKYPVIIFFDAHDNTLSNIVTSDIDRLTYTGDMPQTITVGIVQPDRWNQLNPERKGKAFELFLKNELFKYLDTSYRTLDYHVIIGHSLGGLLATDFLTTSPQDANAVIAISPALSRPNGNDKDTFLINFNKFLLSSKALKNMYVITTGNEGFNDKEYIRNATLKAVYFLEHQQSGLKWKFAELKGQNHATTPLISIPLGLTYIFHSWRFPDELAVQIQDKKIDPLTAIREREDTIMKMYGVPIPINPNAYYAAVDVYKATNKTKNLISIYHDLISLYPNEANNYIGLAEALEKTDSSEAVKYYNMALIHTELNDTESITKIKTKIQQLSAQKK